MGFHCKIQCYNPKYNNITRVLSSSFLTDVYLDKILKEILERISEDEGNGRAKKLKGLPVMTARMMSLPQGVSREGVE